MTAAATGQMCRLTVCGPTRQVEVAVPVHVVIADLLPVLIGHLDENLPDAGLLHGGWVLQRLGVAPFDQDATVATLGLHDGDTIHLRPRSEQIPPVDFDDLIDAVASGVRKRSGVWSPALTRWTVLVALELLLATGIAALALPGAPVARAAVAVAFALACLGAAFVTTFALADRAFGVAFAAAAIAHAGLAGLLAADSGAAAVALRFDAPALFTASVGILAAAAIGAMAIDRARSFFLAVIVADVVTVAAMALNTFTSLSLVDSAAIVLVVSTVVGTMVPLVAFRLAGLRLAPLPTTPEHLQEDLDPIPSAQVLPRAAVADRHMTALYCGLALPTAAALVLVGTADGWAPPTLVALVVLVRCLSARPMTSGWHRLALLGPAAVGACTLLVHLAALAEPLTRLAVVGAAVPLSAAALLGLGRVLPGRRLMPYWGRIGDLTQSVATVAVLPVFLAILNVYGLARAIGG